MPRVCLVTRAPVAKQPPAACATGATAIRRDPAAQSSPACCRLKRRCCGGTLCGWLGLSWSWSPRPQMCANRRARACRGSADLNHAAAQASSVATGADVTALSKLRLQEAVPAEGTQHATWSALAIATGVEGVVALFTGAQDAVPALRGTVAGGRLEARQRQLK